MWLNSPGVCLCDVNWKMRVKKKLKSVSHFLFFLFYLTSMYKWISMSFVIETSLRRFAPLISSCWCNTIVVSIITRLSFSVSLDRFKSYRISMRSFIYQRVIKMSSSKDIDRQIDLPCTPIFPLFSFLFFCAAVHFLYMLRHRIFYATLIIIGKYLYRSLSTERNK